MYGGRSKRIDLAKKAVIVIICIVVIVVSVRYAQREEIIYDSNANYEYLKNYFTSRGYRCGALENSGNKCFLNKENVEYTFYRYIDGFSYYVSGDSYTVIIEHVKTTNGKNGIFINTNKNALENYQNKKYTCSNKEDSVLSDIDTCIDEDGSAINGAYKGLVEKALLEVNNALNSSGYNVSVLVNDFTWNRVI